MPSRELVLIDPLSDSLYRSMVYLVEIYDCRLDFDRFQSFLNQAFLTYSDNLVTSEKLLGSRMKCDTSEPDYPNTGNELFNKFQMTLKNLCNSFLILFS